MKKYLISTIIFSSFIIKAETIPKADDDLSSDEILDEEIQLSPEEISLGSDEIADTITQDIGLPPHRNVTGTRRLICIGVKYSNIDRATTKNACQHTARSIANFYQRNSRGLLTIDTDAYPPFEVKMQGSRASYKTAVEMIKNKYPGFNYYVIPGIFTYSHASAKVAHVKSPSVMTALHEVGHLIGLAHAGKYIYTKRGFELKEYGDTDSIMGRIFSGLITAPQYYHLGWLPEEEVALYDESVSYYDLKKIGNFAEDGLATVVITPEQMTIKDERTAFVSISKCKTSRAGCVSLHLTRGSNSQKVFEVNHEYYDTVFTGIHVKVLEHLDNRIRVAIDFAPKP